MLFENNHSVSPIIGTYYEKGLREINQDSLIIQNVITANGEILLAAICDGLGGMDLGEIASGYICERLSCWFYKDLIELVRKRSSKKLILNSLNRLLFGTHIDLLNYGNNNEIHTGSTISLFLAINNQAYIVNIGDSAIFKIGGHLNRKINKLTPNQSDNKNILNNCIGIGEYTGAFIRNFTIRKNDSILLCSDGFYHYMDSKKIVDASNNANSEEMACKVLKTIGKKNLTLNEKDNMSSILILYRG